MKIAGVRLSDQRLVWVETDDEALAPLDHVRLLLPVGEREGVVYVTPDQLRKPPERVEGRVLAATSPPVPAHGDRDLPGASLPPLGAKVRSGNHVGIVTALDPVENVVTITADGQTIDVPAKSVSTDRS